jgi:hypothetical protein
MSCDLVDALAADMVRGTLEAGPRETVLDHASRCPRCSALLEAERSLSAALAGLAAATEDEAAPARLEERLLKTLAGRNAAHGETSTEPRTGLDAKSRRAATLGVWIAAAAAVVGVAVLISLKHVPIRPRPVTAAASPAADDHASFVSLGYGESLAELESAHVVRVELPGSALAGLGWTPHAGLDASTVTADLVVGPDGIARAIRVLEDVEADREDEGGEGS